MERKVKLLWIGDSPAVTTGFGRVAQGVLESLYNTGNYDISVLGINHSVGVPHIYEGMFRIYPARSSGNVYGFNRVGEVIARETPDVIIINNDLWIAAEYAQYIPAGNRVIVYSPVDALPIYEEWMTALKSINAHLVAYTEFGKTGMKSAGYDRPISIIGHAVDTDEFYPMDDARSFLSNISPDTFIVQSVSRNQPRKRLDLFLKAVKIWLDRMPISDRELASFYFHGAMKDVGWNLAALAKRWHIDDRLIITDQTNFTAATGVPLRVLCTIYNTANVHVLTSMGEGWGLPSFESAACGVAQILPEHSACRELWTGRAPLIKIKDWEVLTGGINTEGGVIDVEHLAEILKEFFYDRSKLKQYAKLAYDFAHLERFTWMNVSRKFEEVMLSVFEAGEKALSKSIGEDNDRISDNETN